MKLKDAEAQAENLDFSNAKQQAMAQLQAEQAENQQAETAESTENTQQEQTEGNEQQDIQQQAQQEAQEAIQAAQEVQAAKQNLQETQQVSQDIQAILAENQMLKEKLAQQQQVQETMSKANEEAIVEQALQPPKLNFDALIYGDEETQQQEIEKYNKELAEYNQAIAEQAKKQAKAEVMKEVQPVLDKFNAEKTETERQAILNELSNMDGFQDIKQYETPIRNLISNNDVLKGVSDPVAQVMTAYTMVRGLNAMKNTAMTPEQFAEMYDKNKEFQDIIEKKRISKLNNNDSQQVPPLSASQGAANSALNIPKKPKTIDEATQLLRNGFFGR